MQSELDKLVELKPCPFCGIAPKAFPDVEDGDGGRACYINCPQCDCLPDGCYRNASEWPRAVEIWNTRAAIQSIGEQQSVGGIVPNLERIEALAIAPGKFTGPVFDEIASIARASIEEICNGNR
jgi:hypothetical protein